MKLLKIILVFVILYVAFFAVYWFTSWGRVIDRHIRVSSGLETATPDCTGNPYTIDGTKYCFSGKPERVLQGVEHDN